MTACYFQLCSWAGISPLSPLPPLYQSLFCMGETEHWISPSRFECSAYSRGLIQRGEGGNPSPLLNSPLPEDKQKTKTYSNKTFETVLIVANGSKLILVVRETSIL